MCIRDRHWTDPRTDLPLALVVLHSSSSFLLEHGHSLAAHIVTALSCTHMLAPLQRAGSLNPAHAKVVTSLLKIQNSARALQNPKVDGCNDFSYYSKHLAELLRVSLSLNQCQTAALGISIEFLIDNAIAICINLCIWDLMNLRPVSYTHLTLPTSDLV